MSTLISNSLVRKTVVAIVGIITAVSMTGGAAVFSADAQALSQSQIDSILNLLSSFGADQTTINNVNSALNGQPTSGGGSGSSGSTGGTGYTFTRNLSMGDTGEDVRQLQMALNALSCCQVASSGAGSPGNESSYFGSLTKTAVTKFQNAYSSTVLAPLGLTAGTGFFGASSRAQLNSLNVGSGSGNQGGGNQGGGQVPSGSGLTVALAPGQPEFFVIPGNVSSQKFSSFIFTAGSQAVTVNEITIGRTQLGDKDDFDDVWITVNGTQKGPDRSLVTGDFANITFNNDPFVIPAGQSVTVNIMGSLSSSAVAGHYNALGLKDVKASTAVNANFPIYGGVSTISTQNATVVTITTQGSDKTVSVGASQTEIGRFKIDVDSSNDQDIMLESILLENEGTSGDLSTVIANPQLKVGGQVVSSSVNLTGDFMQIILNDYMMEDGATQSFTIVADIVNAEVSDTIQLQLDEDSDVVAKEVNSDSGVRVNGNDGTATTPANNVDLKTYTVETGDVNFAINNASSRNVAPGLDDVVLLDGTLTVDSPIKADGLKVRLQSGTAITTSTHAGLQADFENVALKIDGLTIDTVDTLTDNGGGTGALATGSSGDYFNFDSTFNVESGEHAITVEADVKSGATAGDKLKVAIFAADLDSAEYVTSGDQVPSAELTGQVNGSLITIQAAVITVTRNDGFSSEVIIGGVNDLEAFKFTIDANDSSDVEVTSVTFAADGSNTYTTSFVTNLRLFVDGVQVGSSVDLSTGVITDANLTVPGSQQLQATLLIDTNTATAAGQTLQIELDDIDAFDEEGNTATVNHSNGTALSSSNPLESDTFTVNTSGSFTLTIDGDTPDEDILVGDGGSVWYPVATYRLTAEDEDVKLTDLFLMNATSSTDNLASSTFSDARVQTLGLFDEDGILKGQKALTNGGVRFDLGESENPSGFGAVIIPRDDSVKITIRAKVNTINDGDKTGRLLRLVVEPVKTGDNNGTGVIVQSTSTGDDIASSSVTAAKIGSTDAQRSTSTASDFFALRRTKPTIALGSSVTGNLQDGSNLDLFRFNISADANEDVAWKGIKFDVTGTVGTSSLSTTTGTATFQEVAAGAGSSGFINSHGAGNEGLFGFRLYETNGQEVQNGSYVVQLSWDSSDGNGEVAIIMNDGKEEVVGAGSTKNYELRGNVAGVDTSGNNYSISIDREADDAATAAYLVAGSDPDEVDGTADSDVDMTVHSPATNPYSFLWSDNSGSPHSLDDNNATADQRDWTNDRFIEVDDTSMGLSATF